MANDLIQLQDREQDIVISLDQVVDALEKAYAYVEEAGSQLDRLRFRVLLDKASHEELLAGVATLQSEEGFFAAWPGKVASKEPKDADVASSLEVLAVLDDHGLLSDPLLKRWVQAVSKTQAPDGMWGDASAASADARTYVSGMLGAFLVKSGSARLVIVDAALEALATGWSTERVSAGTWPLLAAYFHFLTFASHEIGDEALQWCGREFEKGMRGGVITALEAVRIFLFCDAYALPGVSMDGGRLIPELLREQQPDGSFPASEHALGVQTPVQATLTAVLALSRFSRELQASMPEGNVQAEGDT